MIDVNMYRTSSEFLKFLIDKRHILIMHPTPQQFGLARNNLWKITWIIFTLFIRHGLVFIVREVKTITASSKYATSMDNKLDRICVPYKDRMENFNTRNTQVNMEIVRCKLSVSILSVGGLATAFLSHNIHKCDGYFVNHILAWLRVTNFGFIIIFSFGFSISFTAKLHSHNEIQIEGTVEQTNYATNRQFDLSFWIQKKNFHNRC